LLVLVLVLVLAFPLPPLPLSALEVDAFHASITGAVLGASALPADADDASSGYGTGGGTAPRAGPLLLDGTADMAEFF